VNGFKFAGISAGIKKTDAKDLGLIYCETPASAAALFTRNKVVAAPVILGREVIKSGKIQAILVNSGNANCFTGQQGVEDADRCAQLAARALDIPKENVLVSSTGVIGQPLPMERFETGIPRVVGALSAGGVDDFATAILTTDLVPKVVKVQFEINGRKVGITGMAKGSGMIRPNMATMLAFVCTDAQLYPDELKSALTAANEVSFSKISVDGDTSTNDSLFALASGQSGVAINDEASREQFQKCLNFVCYELAKRVVKDGEGATKVIKITVKGAKSREDASNAAQTIAHSNLVKTAIYGEDPNWGRITAAAGRSGAQVDQDKMDLFFEQIPLVLNGRWQGLKMENKAAAVMKKDQIHITLDLNLGDHSDWFLFCDFSENYVKINADYRS
jgi:glutamate N-acetyltransferase/amino-acid N-acetyltransferase